jgi:hypothetical protein
MSESEVLDTVMRDKLDIASDKSCSPEGHKALCEYLVMAHQLHCDTRSDVKVIREIAEAKGSVFGNVAWGKPVKMTGLGGMVGTVLYIFAKIHGWIPWDQAAP